MATDPWDNSLLQQVRPEEISDEHARQVVVGLLNLVEAMRACIQRLREENQQLRDEIARLKGEQGKPKVPPQKPPAAPTNHSSEKERKLPVSWHKSAKMSQIRIDRTEPLRLDRNTLPPDAQFKGYEEKIVQDIVFRSDNICFQREKYYSPSLGKTYLAPLPPGYEGDYGPGVKSLALDLSFGANVSEAQILRRLRNVGICISGGSISNLLIEEQEVFHAEKAEVYAAGLASSPWQHIDTTPTRVNGVNHSCHVVCNPLYTAYFTTSTQERLAVLGVLRGERAAVYLLNERAFAYLERARVAQATRRLLQGWPQGQELSAECFEALLTERLPGLGVQTLRLIREAAAIAAYRAQRQWPVVRLLECDDADQFKGLTEELALCWVHEGRHYKKLTPWAEAHREVTEKFRKRFWDYYDELLAYRQQPCAEEKVRLSARFDELFGTVTGYDCLDDRIALTLGKKTELLKVLEHPEIPLHNNPAELGARGRVRKRDVSFGPRCEQGRRAWDTFATLAATCAKLGISFYAYLRDRITRGHAIPRLAEVIAARAADMNLAASWGPT
jgi:hypothetical protein